MSIPQCRECGNFTDDMAESETCKPCTTGATETYESQRAAHLSNGGLFIAIYDAGENRGYDHYGYSNLVRYNALRREFERRLSA